MDKDIENLKKQISGTLDEMGILAKKIILFGSRARGKISKYSDYDFLIITEKTFSIHEKMEISKSIRENLAKFALDVIVKSEDEVKKQKSQIGTVVREALKEGIEI